MTFGKSTKLPAMVLAWENLQEVFVMLVVVTVFTSLEVFTFPGYFSLPPALHPSFSGPGEGPPLAVSSTLATFICFTFARLFSVTVLPQTLRFWVGVFYPQGFFTLRSFINIFGTFLWLRCGQEHPIQDLLNPLCLPLQSCPFRMTHGLELFIL